MDKLFFIIARRIQEYIIERRTIFKKTKKKNCFLFKSKKKVIGENVIYYDSTTEANRTSGYCSVMKIFKRDPADISLPNFTNHSQWPTTGSHLPINFPSVVLVSGCPITSNNGHPRAIYRVCARHECLQTRERSSKQRS